MLLRIRLRVSEGQTAPAECGVFYVGSGLGMLKRMSSDGRAGLKAAASSLDLEEDECPSCRLIREDVA